jgi:hypothetical protein
VSESTSDTEQWLPVVGYEGYYEVSDHGRVRSVDRWIITKIGIHRFCRGRILRPAKNTGGYLSIVLCINNTQNTKAIHDLVLRAFVGPPPKSNMECLHGPLGKQHNYANQLKWGTHQENIADMLRDGVNRNNNKTHCPRNHKLIHPNLSPYQLTLGRRMCLACARAHANQQRAKQHNNVVNFNIQADKHYARIMNTS